MGTRAVGVRGGLIGGSKAFRHLGTSGSRSCDEYPIMTNHSLPSDRFPLPVHFDVLRRFMSVSHNGAEPVTPLAVEGGDLPSGAAQLNVAFLAETGFLIEEAPGKFKPTPVAMQLINTQSADEQRGRKLLRSLVAKLWFARTAAALRQTNPNAKTPELIAKLVEEASATTSAERRAMVVLLEYLTYTGLVEPEPFVSRPPESLPASASPEVRPAGGGRAARRPAAASGSPSAWRIVRTDDFELRIRPNREAVHRLRRQLDLLDEELATD